MIKGLYTAVSGMLTNLKLQDVVAESLANINTVGFKRERAVASEFGGVLARRVEQSPSPFSRLPGGVTRTLGRVGAGSYVSNQLTNLGDGSERETGVTLDFMLRGAGFFAVQGPEGTVYTRDGHFGRNAENLIVTADGFPILGVDGEPITLRTDAVRVTQDGRLFVEQEVETTQPDGTVVTEIAEVLIGEFAVFKIEAQSLVPSDNSRYSVLTGATATAAELGQETFVRQGSLEEANVEVTQLATQLMSLSRSFSAGQQVFATVDETLRTAVTELGRVQR